MNYRRYWDLSEKQRALLSEEAVRSFLAVELMENGVPKMPELELRAVPETEIAKHTIFRIRATGHDNYGSVADLPIAFGTSEAALAFLALKPLAIEYDYETRTSAFAQLKDACVRSEDVPTQEAVKKQSLVLREKRIVEEANTKAEQEHKKAVEFCEKTTQHMWEDWHACRQRAEQLRRVIETREEYVKLAGDEMLAEKFLLKAFPAEKIAEAREWAAEVAS